MYKIGIIGYGHVGKAIRASFKTVGCDYSMNIIDPLLNTSVSYDEIKKSDVIFICVPSPESDSGHCDTSILSSVLGNLHDYKGLIISKVTAPPDFYSMSQNTFTNLVYIPEFLTAANAFEDYTSTKYHIIGGNNKAYCSFAREIIELTFGMDCDCRFVSIEEASMIKYAINSFLATKVIWMNELKDLCDKVNIDYHTVSTYMSFDRRIGKSHMQVPGPDGEKGFGGLCLPKDTKSLLTYARENDILLTVLNSVLEKNKDYR